MAGISVWQLLILSIIVLLPYLLFGPILKKAGFSKWWSLIMLIPVINVVAVWIFAFAKWPIERYNL
ncbi:hypothetical protein F0232_23875 [Vibrio sp. T3Y01]|nr:hypothetical protein [Vibrio sp. T3Y01]PQJ56177.1 hypothetical protein BTO12_01095 [Vibrio splendidus]